MLLNAKLNDTSHKTMWEESVHLCERIINNMATMGSTTSPFENVYEEKPNIIGLFSDFGRIGYVTKWYKIKKKITDKILEAILV